MKEQDISIEEMEWRARRLGRFTASEMHKLFVSGRRDMTPEELEREKDKPAKERRKTVETLFGEGSETYIRTKAAEILTMESKEQGDFKQTEWGKANEAAAVKEFEKITGKRGTHYGVNNPKFFEYGDYAGGSPDWQSLDGTEGADIKCPYNTAEHVNNLFMKSAEDFEQLHYDYYCQAQALMVICKWKCFHFISYDPRMIEPKYRIKILTIYPDLAWREEFETRLKAATEKLQDILNNLDVVIARYDTELQTTLIERA